MDMLDFTTQTPVSVRSVQQALQALLQETIEIPYLDEQDGPTAVLTATDYQQPCTDFSLTGYLADIDPVPTLLYLARVLKTEVLASIEWQDADFIALATPAGELFEAPDQAADQGFSRQRRLLPAA